MKLRRQIAEPKCLYCKLLIKNFVNPMLLTQQELQLLRQNSQSNPKRWNIEKQRILRLFQEVTPVVKVILDIL